MSTSSDASNAAQLSPDADDVFGRIASRYGLLCDLFSFGIHRYWKNRAAAMLAADPWRDLIDAGTGTGDIVVRLLRRQAPDPARRILATDLSPQMLAIARERIEPLGRGVEFHVLDAGAMPAIPTASMDVFTTAFVFKICDRGAVLREAMRILRPGGRLVVLEASNLRSPLLNRAYLLYMSLCMPLIGWIATRGDSSAYQYLLRGIQNFPDAEGLAAELGGHGFRDITFVRLSLGIVALHRAVKPRE